MGVCELGIGRRIVVSMTEVIDGGVMIVSLGNREVCMGELER